MVHYSSLVIFTTYLICHLQTKVSSLSVLHHDSSILISSHLDSTTQRKFYTHSYIPSITSISSSSLDARYRSFLLLTSTTLNTNNNDNNANQWDDDKDYDSNAEKAAAAAAAPGVVVVTKNSGFDALWNRMDMNDFKRDEVVRVMDANTVKLKRSGLVSFASVRTPTGYGNDFRFPECMSRSPISKAKQMLPQGTEVLVRIVGGSHNNNNKNNNENNNKKAPAWIILSNGNDKKHNNKLVNAELVREGFAKPTLLLRRGSDESQMINDDDAPESIIPGITQLLMEYQSYAKNNGLGMYAKCDTMEIPSDDQFEPLDFTVETQYFEDGGRQVRVETKKKNGMMMINHEPPKNPGDSRGCTDFRTFEDALQWYDFYFPFYGDVAKLDRDGDGVPCSGLPHTTDQTRYRIKKPIIPVPSLKYNSIINQ